MQSPLRIIYTDSLTGEPDYVDVIQGEFDALGVVEAIERKWSEFYPEDVGTLTPLAWALDHYGTTACFIIRWDRHLLHGACYTMFDPDYAPLLK